SARLACSAQVVGLCSVQSTEGSTMPWKVKKPTAADVSADWLRPYCTLFLQKLADQGYAPATMRTYAGATAPFCQEVARRGLGHGQLVGQTLSKVRAAALKGIYPNEYNKKIILPGTLHRCFGRGRYCR